MFPLTWTLMHTIDEHSPMHGFDQAKFLAADSRIFFSIEARDPSLSAIVYDMRSYQPQSVRFGMRYADAISIADDGTPIADMTRVSALEPDTGIDKPHPGWTEHEEAALEDQ